ncbi:LysR family transcriptional regulator [Vibrio sp. H11]|uniref:LysR family transcriptional regulator n=1 Tax=Vibrio sp. H11 TaxID=2565928 RepID=UPI0010A66F4C|nr:LysR family transcriptional regulator [Vibrio sp. H11]
MRHLKAFYVFHVAAESANHSQAAEKLHITHGAVSKQIKLLENHLGHMLFYKQGRGMRLSTEGKLLKQYTDTAFSALDTGVKKLARASHRSLEVSCEPTLTMRWLMPRLADFYQHSGIDVRLSTAGGPVNLEQSGLDLAIQRDDFAIDGDNGIHDLVPEWVGPVFSPQYWNRVRHNLDDMVLLHSETRPAAWEEWLKGRAQAISLRNAKSFGHFYFCLQAAADGLGAAIGSYPLVADDLHSGRLVAPWGFSPSGHRYILLSSSMLLTQSQQQFLQWLQKKMVMCQPDRVV